MGGAISTLETATSFEGNGSGSSLGNLVSSDSEGPSSGLYVNWSCLK